MIAPKRRVIKLFVCISIILIFYNCLKAILYRRQIVIPFTDQTSGWCQPLNTTFSSARVTLYIPPGVTEASSRNVEVLDFGEFLDKRSWLHFIQVGSEAGEFVVMAGMHRRRVVAVPNNVPSARCLRRTVSANKIDDRVFIVGNSIGLLNIGNLNQVIKFKEAILYFNVKHLTLSTIENALPLFRKVTIAAVVINRHSSISQDTDGISKFLRRLQFEPHSRFVGRSLLSRNSSTWPDFVIWKPVLIKRSMSSTTTTAKVSIFDVMGQMRHFFPSKLIKTHYGRPLTICTYDAVDRISRALRGINGWRRQTIKSLQAYLDNQPDVYFIDIGAYVGVFALQVAVMGRKVVAVDANKNNLLRMGNSVVENKFKDRVTLVHNAVGDERGVRYLKSTNTDVASARVISEGSEETRVMQIYADDLLPYIPFSKAVLKLDVNGMEADVLSNAEKLFSKVHIPVILMPWKSGSEDKKKINQFFTKRGYKPFKAIASEQTLSADYSKWPRFIVWKLSALNALPKGITVSSRNDRIRLYAPKNVGQHYPSFLLHSPGGRVNIFGYPSNHDVISRIIAQTGSWEKEMTQVIGNLLTSDQNLQFLDIGANIGVYTLTAAKLGKKVLAVDANINNLKRLRKSIISNKMENFVTLVWNAIDSSYSTVQMHIQEGNIGGSYVVDIHDESSSLGSEVQTITMDDLVNVVDFKKAILKYDIEGKEYDGLLKASKLFKAIEIPFVFMEWGVIVRDYPKYGGIKWPRYIIEFFEKRNYKPYGKIFDSSSLKSNFHSWPWDIIWKKMNSMPTDRLETTGSSAIQTTRTSH